MFDSVEQRGGRNSPFPPIDSKSGDSLRSRWLSLCSEFLPFHEKESLWRHRRGWLPTDPHQGWKVHVSATILTACEVLRAVAPYLKKIEVEFKAAASLDILDRLNAGIFHGYAQIGKCITIYPADEDQFRGIVEYLYEQIPNGIAAPSVPFDIRYKDSNIYYRYGSFITKLGEEAKIRRQDGELVEDRRDSPCPEWVTPPFTTDTFFDASPTESPFGARYAVYSAVSQRGKGGVYKAVSNFSSIPMNVMIKEGRRNGETAWDGRDGRSRVENEVTVLRELRSVGVDVPIVYESFQVADNVYGVLEEISGENLNRLIGRSDYDLTPADTLYICKQIAKILADVHAAGWVWRDCKPANLFITTEKTVRPIDFEGAHRVNESDPLAWSTPNFSAPEVFRPDYKKDPRYPFAEDLYSLGATLYSLLTGWIPGNDGKPAMNVGRHTRIPSEHARNSVQITGNVAANAWNVGDLTVNVEQAARNPSSDSMYDKQDSRKVFKYSSHSPADLRNSSGHFPNSRGISQNLTLLSSTIDRLVSPIPTERPTSTEVYEEICLVEAHLNEQIAETSIIAHAVK